MLDIPFLLSELAKERPVFHSEADFQHALAWKIRELHSDAKVRLERKVAGREIGLAKPIYLDLWVELHGEIAAIELKYQTVAIEHDHLGERFSLGGKGAEDNLGYDFIKDVRRLEGFVHSRPNAVGHAILLSNQPVWKHEPTGREYSKDAFRIHDGRVIEGTLMWRKVDKAGQRASALELRDAYLSSWEDYSDLGGKLGRFRYLWLRVSGSSTPQSEA